MPTSSWDYTFSGPSGFGLTYNNTNPAAISWRAPSVNLANPNLYTLSGAVNGPFQEMDKEWSGALDATAPLAIDDYDGLAKFGFSARLRVRSSSQDQTTYAPVGAPTIAQLASGAPQIYYNGLYDIGPDITDQALSRIPLVPNGLAPTNPGSDYVTNQEAWQHDSENVYAFYGMYTVTVDRLGLLGGARVELTDGTYKANVGATNSDGTITTITPTTQSTSYTDVFPSLQAKYGFSDRLQARAAFSTAIARPGFNQNTAAKTIDLSASTISVGNPGLKPTTGIAFDIAIEYYLANGGIVSAGAFDKEFDNYIVATSKFVAPPTSGTGEFM